MDLLVVEDDPRICDVLDYALKADGYSVRLTHRGREAVELVRELQPALIILDVGLPDIDGFEVCRLVRTFSECPIIFLTSRTDEINRVVGLEIGGDDYVLKPFSTRELLARIKAIRRRNQPGKTNVPASVGTLNYGPLALDRQKFRARCGERDIVLTAQEFRLVELLVKSPGRVFTRDQLLDLAWGDGGIVTDRAIDAHVKTLRKKFGDFDFIETVRGVGYRARELDS
ncbi:MAG: response regulator [Verrucomicrobiota bacterium]|nr:response regulator [Verrucomicrobiota bacterium]